MSFETWKGDCYILPVGVDCHVNEVVPAFFFVIAGEAYAEGAGISRDIHFVCVDVVSVDRVHATDGIRELLVDNCVLLAECDHKFEEFKEIAVFVKHAPVEPGDPAVLTVAVVVSVFGISKFIAGEEHRCSAAAHQDGTGIADHAVAKCENFRIISFTFGTTVPASVVVCTVCIVPSICFIVLIVVSIKIIKRKSVMAGEEVDAGIITCIIALVISIETAIKVTGAGNTPGCIPRLPAVALEEASQRITVSSVPLCPSSARRETSNLVKTAGIPCFRDQLDIA